MTIINICDDVEQGLFDAESMVGDYYHHSCWLDIVFNIDDEISTFLIRISGAITE